MSDKITVEVDGIEKCIQNLKSWQVIKTEATKIALLETGLKTERDAKMRCPVDTGRLRGSISINWSGSPMFRGSVDPPAKLTDGIVQPPGRPGLVIVVGTNVEYAPYVEFGTIRPLKWGGYRLMPGRPYLLPAKQQNEKELEARIKKIFKK